MVCVITFEVYTNHLSLYQYASSFNTNTNKFMLVNFDCSLLWVKDRFKLTQAMVVDPLYLQHSFSEKSIDYRVSKQIALVTN